MKSKKRKIIIIITFIICLIIIIGLTTIKKTDHTSNNKKVNTSEGIVGNWYLADAQLDGKWYDKRKIFGNCIEKQNSLKITDNNTYTFHVGCNEEEIGTLSVNLNKISFNNNAEKQYDATYEEDKKEPIIKYHYPTEAGEKMYLIFKKSK